MKAGLVHTPARLREIPSVHALMRRESVNAEAALSGRALTLHAVRGAADLLRASMLSGATYASREEMLLDFDRQFQNCVQRLRLASLRSVINATGVILHTNLGRAPLAEETIAALSAIAGGYSNLEYDLKAGARGYRDSHCEPLLEDLTGCEAAAVVNNNAAAVLLVLNTLAQGMEVVISRGELVEIGGSFRIPEIMVKAGAQLVEVGTTNRTRLSDYEGAISDRTGLVLRVHQSNFKMIGFSERPDLHDLVALAQRRGLPLFEDLGSGCLVDLLPWHVPGEPRIQQSIAAGVDLCAFSGDKLLGGPQAGIITGSRELVDQVRRNPWMRAVRPDKLTLTALESTLRLYRDELAPGRLPVLRMIGFTEQNIRRRAQSFVRKARRSSADRLNLKIVSGHSTIGGGCAPEARLPTALVAITHPALSLADLEQRLRHHDPPVITRMENDQLVLDLRTVQPSEEPVILQALAQI